METYDFKIRVPVGIHVRNALLLIQQTVQYQSNITLCRGMSKANAKKLMEIMLLRVKGGDEVHFFIEGPDEKDAVLNIGQFCEKNL